MPKCPKCGKEIDYLTNFVIEEYKLTIDENGNGYHELVDCDDDYQCPECATILFRDEEKAVKFLKGERLAKGE